MRLFHRCICLRQSGVHFDSSKGVVKEWKERQGLAFNVNYYGLNSRTRQARPAARSLYDFSSLFFLSDSNVLMQCTRFPA